MAKSFLNMPGYPIGLRNNNPGNLRPGDNWQGMIGESGGFLQFQDCSWGLRALGIDLTTKINSGYNTIEKIISRYAPPSENDTQAYIGWVGSVVDYTGLSATRVLTADAPTLRRLMRAIMNVELGTNFSALITDADINEGLSMIDGSVINPGTVGFSIATALFLLSLYLLATMPKMPKS